ncbi:MAG: hypothetical protein GY754_09110 [bacterium]|nr:hypothetical protein [bacterium]
MKISLRMLLSIQLGVVLILLLGGSSLHAEKCNAYLGKLVKFPCSMVDQDDKSRTYTLEKHLARGSYKNAFLTESGKVLAISNSTDKGAYGPTDKPLHAEYKEVALIEQLRKFGYPMIEEVGKVGRFLCFKVDSDEKTTALKEAGGCIGYPMANYVQYDHTKRSLPKTLSEMKNKVAFNKFKKAAVMVLDKQIKANKMIADFQYFANKSTGDLFINDPQGYVSPGDKNFKHTLPNMANIKEDLIAVKKLEFGQNHEIQASILKDASKISSLSSMTTCSRSPISSAQLRAMKPEISLEEMKTRIKKAIAEKSKITYSLKKNYGVGPGIVVVPLKLADNIFHYKIGGEWLDSEDLELISTVKVIKKD